MKKTKAVPLQISDDELEVLMEYWLRVIRYNGSTLGELDPITQSQEYKRVAARIATAEEKIRYWHNMKERKSKECKVTGKTKTSHRLNPSIA